MASTADDLFDVMFAREPDGRGDFFWGCDLDDSALDDNNATESNLFTKSDTVKGVHGASSQLSSPQSHSIF